MIDWTGNFFLLRLLFHFERLKALLVRRSPALAVAENLRAGFYEKLWRHAASHLGASFEALGYGVFQISRDHVQTRVCDSTTAMDDPVTLAIAGNKPLVYRLLAREGLAIPRHREFALKSIARAVAFLEETQECVVKPASGTGAGRGITTGIRSRSQLGRAAVAAAMLDCHLLIEEQVSGKNYRLLYLDGILLDAVERRPPAILGDGRATVKKLVAKANAERLARGEKFSVLLTIDQDMRQTLARQGLSLHSVVAPGIAVILKTVVNQNFAQENVSASSAMCPSVVADGARAARAMGARLAGIDIITSDPGIPLAQAGGVILEVNTTPGLHHHCRPDDGSCPVAVQVLEQLLKDRELPSLSGPGGENGQSVTTPVSRTLSPGSSPPPEVVCGRAPSA